MTAKSNKQKRKPKVKKEPGDRNIRKLGDPDDFNNRRPSWIVGRIDRYCQWGWEELSKDELWNNILSKLMNFESMNWGIIIRKGSHNIKVDKLIPNAKKRLKEKRLDDIEELFSLRLAGLPRIWGILNNGVLSILWYDPKHEVCPSEMKNT